MGPESTLPADSPAGAPPALQRGSGARVPSGGSWRDLLSRASELGPRIPRSLRFADSALMALRARTRKPHLLAGRRARTIERRARALVREGDAGRILEVPRIDARDYPAGELLRVFKTETSPIVLAGFGEDCDAVRTWTPDFFAEQYGDFKMQIDLHKDDGMTVAEVVEGMRSGDPDKFVSNFSDILNAHEELREALPLEAIRAYTGQRSFHGVELFMGGQGAPFHCANMFNFYLMVHGSKQWTFVHPHHSVFMAPKFNRDIIFAGSELPPDAVPPVAMLRTTLLPGDVLVNPPWWWHTTINRTSEVIGVATRWYPIRQRFRSANTFFSWMQWAAPHQWRLFLAYQLVGRPFDDAVMRQRIRRY